VFFWVKKAKKNLLSKKGLGQNCITAKCSVMMLNDKMCLPPLYAAASLYKKNYILLILLQNFTKTGMQIILVR